jgi:hypothetical protein
MGLIIDHATPRLPAPLPLPLPAPRRFIHLLLGLLLCLLAAAAARAQILDDLEFRREGADAVLQIRFTTGVQYQRSVVARSGDETLIFYRVLPARQSLTLQTAERRLPARPGANGGSGLPAVRVVDEGSVVGRDTDRRVLVRLGAPAKQRVRAGRTDRVLELVFEGLGAQLSQPVPAAELPVGLAGRFRVTLEATEEAGSFLSAPIPATLQDANLFTTRRVANGKMLYETHLGPYATRGDFRRGCRCWRGRRRGRDLGGGRGRHGRRDGGDRC